MIGASYGARIQSMKMQDKSLRVVIADRSSLFRDGIASLLENAGHEVILQTGDGVSTLQSTLDLRPDLVLIDADLPGMDSMTVTAKIKAGSPGTKVVILTGMEDDKTLFAAIRVGTDGYLSKDLNAGEFIEMLAGLERGEAAVTRKTAARLMAGFQEAIRENKTLNCLTNQEIRVLRLIRDGSSNRQIAETLFISENTVKYHVRNILQKLGVKNRTEAVVYAPQEKLLDEAQD